MNFLGKDARSGKTNGTKLTTAGGLVTCRDLEMRPQEGLTESRLLMLARKTSVDMDSTTNTGFTDGSIFFNIASSGVGVDGNTIVRMANIPKAVDSGVTPTIPTKIGVSELYIDSDGYVRYRLV